MRHIMSVYCTVDLCSYSILSPIYSICICPNHQVLTAQVSDTGRYMCVADNVAGSAEKSFNLNVHGESHVKWYIKLTLLISLFYFYFWKIYIEKLHFNN